MTVFVLSRPDIAKASITDKCCVLDLDATLISTADSIESLKKMKIMSDPKLMKLRKRTYYLTIDDLEKPGIGTKYSFWGITRPHLEEFLIFCFSYFKIVAVWSAGKRPYVEAIVDHIFKDISPPHIVFTHDDIDIGPKGHIIKNLNKLIESNATMRKHMSLQNTLAIDDNSTTFSKNKGNGVLIPAYEPALSVEALSRDDNTLKQLMLWLLTEEVIASNDVSSLNKSEIFTTKLEDYKKILESQPKHKLKSN